MVVESFTTSSDLTNTSVRFGLRPCCESSHRAAFCAASAPNFYRTGFATGDNDEVSEQGDPYPENS